VFSPNAIAILAGPAFVGIVAIGLAGCRIPEDGPLAPIPAPLTITPRYTAPESTIPILPTYGPGLEGIEVSQ
jgi:hypothetical protein